MYEKIVRAATGLDCAILRDLGSRWSLEVRGPDTKEGEKIAKNWAAENRWFAGEALGVIEFLKWWRKTVLKRGQNP